MLLYGVPHLKQDIEEVVNIVNVVLVDSVYEQIRGMSKRGKARPIFGRRRARAVVRQGPAPARNPRAVRNLVVKTAIGLTKNYANKELTKLPTYWCDSLDLWHDRMKLNPVDMDLEQDRSKINRTILRLVRNHMIFRKRKDEVRSVVFGIARRGVWKRYWRSGELPKDGGEVGLLNIGETIGPTDVLVLMLSDEMDLDPFIVEVYTLLGEEVLVRLLQEFGGRTISLPSVRNVKDAYKAIEIYRKVEEERKHNTAKDSLKLAAAEFDVKPKEAGRMYSRVRRLLRLVTKSAEEMREVDVE